MSELKPCHVCGATSGLYVLEDYEGLEWYVFCDNCKTSVHSEHALTKEDAIKVWNTRYVDENKLKPCPYCGGEAEVSTYEAEHDIFDQKTLGYLDTEYYVEYFVSCSECWARTYEKRKEAEAIRAWNTRI